MAKKITYTAPDGTVHNLPLPEGADPAQVVSDFENAQGFSAPLSSIATLPKLDSELDADIPTSIEEANRRRGRATPLIGTNVPTTTPERVERGLALGARSVAGAIPKTATGVADLGSMVLNLIPELISRGDVALGGKPLPESAFLPTDATAQLDEFLNEIFPEPQGMAERIAVGTGELALTGGAGGAALTSRVVPAARAAALPRGAVKGSVVPGAETQSLGASILDDIGAFFATRPKTAATLEVTGGAGAVTGGELAEKAELSPAGRMLATTVGGLAGGVAPAALSNVASRAGRSLIESVAPATKVGATQRAARRVQEATADPAADVQAIKDRPEGVTPARATENVRLRTLEENVIKGDPDFEASVTQGLEAAENTGLQKLADQFGPTTNKAEWQQEVILRGTPDDATIKIGQPDEMLDSAFKTFDAAYDPAKGVQMRTQTFGEGRPQSLRSVLDEAAGNPLIIADKKWRTGIERFLRSLLDDTVTRGRKTGGPDDDPIHEVLSDDLLEMRSVVRQEARRRRKAGETNARSAAEADMLDEANRGISRVIEAQLVPDAAEALRAVDARYATFKTVESAVVRSGEKGLTPEALRAAVRAGTDTGRFARGRGGELAVLAETGKDIGTTLAPSARKPGNPEAAARIVRTMNDDQLKLAKADLSDALQNKATRTIDGQSRLDGKKMLDEIDRNRDVLKAAKFSDEDIVGMETIAKELKMIQSRSPNAVEKLLTDNVSTVMRLLAAVAGSRAGTRVLKLFGGTAGAGPSLILAGFGARQMRQFLRNLSVDTADELLRAAFRGETVPNSDQTLLEALLTTPTSSTSKQAQAARSLEVFLIESVKQVSGEQSGDKTVQEGPQHPIIGTKSKRPNTPIINPDGSQSSEQLMTIGLTGESGVEKTALLPTIVKDDKGFLVKVSRKEALRLHRTGKNPAVGFFDSIEEADKFAVGRSAGGGRFSGITPEQ